MSMEKEREKELKTLLKDAEKWFKAMAKEGYYYLGNTEEDPEDGREKQLMLFVQKERGASP